MQTAPPLDSNAIIRLAWIALLALAATGLPLTITMIIAVRRVPQGMNPVYTLSNLFESRALQMVTVILIVIAAAFLALIHVIDSNGVVGILSGIAGYVLGGLQKEPKAKQEAEKRP